jgi:hypothetical protein
MGHPRMTDLTETTFPLSPAVEQILSHLCKEQCHAYGDLLEWCETRGDCSHAVVCPVCRTQFVIDEDELDELRLWTARYGNLLVCGINYDS